MAHTASNPKAEVEDMLESACPMCNGSGRFNYDKCGACSGTGYVATKTGKQILSLVQHNLRRLLEETRSL
jgi:DnaJ-class molecular chaperone